jgi:hypothetical protein
MKLKSKRYLNERYERWDLEVEDNHNFVAEGVVVHNSNARVGRFINPQTDEYAIFVGSHHRVLKEGDNVYWNTARALMAGRTMPKDMEFFFEAYGGSVQKGMSYGLKQAEPRVFAISIDGRYVAIPDLITMCEGMEIPTVPFKSVIFESVEQMRQLANEPSEVDPQGGIREGIVVVSNDYPERMAKVIGEKYYSMRAKKGDKLSERH